MQEPSRAATSWSCFAPHRGAPFAFFIDRAGDARLSFAGSRPREQLRIDRDGGARLWSGGQWTSLPGDPIANIAAFVERGRCVPRVLPEWLAGAPLPRTVGFLAYELGLWADHGPIPSSRSNGTAQSALGTPLAVLSTYDQIDAWNPNTGRAEQVRFCMSPRDGEVPVVEAPDHSTWRDTTRGAYRAGFERIHDAIAAGDIYQANLSRRAVFDVPGDAAAAYEKLRRVQPVPWGSFLDFGGFALLSNSPECFLVRDGERVFTQPIKGTRPRSANAADDAAQAGELLRDPKEMAEHLMIVDLERSDLGRVARTGSVVVERLAAVESFATVHHVVSDVSAVLREGTGVGELVRATFPGGSITGAPKLRAMQILREVEETERGPYTGAIGFFHGAEQLELSIAIRTAIVSEGRGLSFAGGGIVADSDPDREWNETELKLAAFREALAERISNSLKTPL